MSGSQILPGAWLGVLGGGQLGRMFAQAAERHGYHVATFEPEINSPAAQVVERHFCSSLQPEVSDQELVRQMSELCQVVTLEFENIDSTLVRIVNEHSLARPGVEFLEICQDRQREKESVAKIGCPTTPFRAVATQQQAALAAQELG